jgi:hypothetical protein
MYDQRVQPSRSLIPLHFSSPASKTAMPQCDIVETTENIPIIARRLALLLPASNAKKQTTLDERMEWFRYTREQTCYEEFNALLLELIKIVCIGPKSILQTC